MIKDRNGRIIKSDSGQDRLLHLLYDTLPGRILLKPLTAPVVSKLAGVFMDSPLSVPMIKPFIEKNNINLSEFYANSFRSFNAFFTRRIRPELRPIDSAKSHLISPCDSKLTVYKINGRSIFRIKDSYYRISDLLRNKFMARRYQGGYCMIFRLCVDDYHRYCYIDDGIKNEDVFIKGELHTVNPIALEQYNIYKRNCREYTMLHTENFGDVVQVEVGAMLVGRIKNRHWNTHCFSKGEEKGMFEYGGSTVVLLFEKDTVAVDKDILANSAKGIETAVKYGEKIGAKKL
ncbi:MAG: phosphatidylserine decarboxylase [Ruminococcus flavefaciens]|nr:phosphatidylserine decarboxylase [Ruminococcus flavefaciens]MCM1228588.1 phosphatidylserine decarboxylase [Ruminococcus flavefaciens]